VDRRGAGDRAALEQRKLGGAASDVDIEQAVAAVVRNLGCAGAIRREHRFHVVSGGGADELAAELGKQLADRLRILAPQRFAGQDHRAGVDVVRVKPGAGISLVDDLAHRVLVDAHLAGIGRERDGRLVERLAVDHEVAARQFLAEAAHVQPRKDHLRAGRADVDADAGERYVVVRPERVVFERCRRTGIVVVIVV
jgi:hypothetical protein